MCKIEALSRINDNSEILAGFYLKSRIYLYKHQTTANKNGKYFLFLYYNNEKKEKKVSKINNYIHGFKKKSEILMSL